MDSLERLRLIKEYEAMPDEQILELLSDKRENFKEGVYEIILGEARKRNLSIPKQEKKPKEEEIKESDIIICNNCGYPNSKENTICENCGLTFTSGFDPLSVAIAQGKFYGKLTKQDRKKNPIRLMGRIIVALELFIQGLFCIALGIHSVINNYMKGGFLGFLIIYIIGIFSIALGVVIFKPILTKKKQSGKP